MIPRSIEFVILAAAGALLAMALADAIEDRFGTDLGLVSRALGAEVVVHGPAGDGYWERVTCKMNGNVGYTCWREIYRVPTTRDLHYRVPRDRGHVRRPPGE